MLNENIRYNVVVFSIVEKMRKSRLKWLGHNLRKKETEAIRLVKEMYVGGKRERGRPENRRLDGIESGMN